MADAPLFTTNIGSATEHDIFVRGHNLVDELIGNLSFTEMAFLTIMGRKPKENERKMLDAVLVSLMDHGITMTALNSRMTYANAPEAIQGAVAGGLLLAGSVTLGTMEGCGKLLTELVKEAGGEAPSIEAVRARLKKDLSEGKKIAGIGHPTHKGKDPRAQKLLGLAEENGIAGIHVALLREVQREAEAISGRNLPINVTGAIAAVLLEMGVEWQILRGFALMSRVAGIIAHIREERELPMTPTVRRILRT